jgi:Family of unknown function (DUF5372)
MRSRGWPTRPLERLGRRVRTALSSSKLSGWVEITHPFHPLRGQRFEILTYKSTATGAVLTLKGPPGNFLIVPLEWTDAAPPRPFKTGDPGTPILDAWLLLKSCEIVEAVSQRESEDEC